MFNFLGTKSATLLRMYCKSPDKLTSDKVRIYHKALTISDGDAVTLPEIINKGFGLLTLRSDERVVAFSSNARSLFNKARELDTQKNYSNEIECGLEQAAGVIPECYHVATPKEHDLNLDQRRESLTADLKAAIKKSVY